MQEPKIKIASHLAIITDDHTKKMLKGHRGTASFVEETSDDIEFTSLDRLTTLNNFTEVAFIKIDTDGYDYKVLNSSKEVIQSQKPIILFELQIENNTQLTGYIESLKFLEGNGYEHFYVFDNYGQLILKSENRVKIIELVEYIGMQDNKRGTRTIFYLDILASTKRDSGILISAIESYKSEKTFTRNFQRYYSN